MANSQDYFGYSKQVYGPGNIATTPMVLLAIQGDGGVVTVRLAQSVTIRYNRNVQPQYELGSDNVWFVAGGANGSLDVSRAVGNVGDGKLNGALLEPYKPGSACSAQTLTLQKGVGSCGLNPGKITAKGVLQSVTGNFQTSQTLVTDGATWSIGDLRIS